MEWSGSAACGKIEKGAGTGSTRKIKCRGRCSRDMEGSKRSGDGNAMSKPATRGKEYAWQKMIKATYSERRGRACSECVGNNSARNARISIDWIEVDEEDVSVAKVDTCGGVRCTALRGNRLVDRASEITASGIREEEP